MRVNQRYLVVKIIQEMAKYFRVLYGTQTEERKTGEAWERGYSLPMTLYVVSIDTVQGFIQDFELGGE